MPIVNRLIDIYEQRGFLVSTGLNPCHFENFKPASFTWLIKESKNHTDGLGISTQEIYFLECLFEEFSPKNIFIVGNSFGWSTFAMSLLNPASKIVAIDSGFSKNSLDGIDFTNRTAKEENLRNVLALQAASPQDVEGVVKSSFEGPVDFVFIDAMHTNEHILLDFTAVQPVSAENCVFLFHDIHQYDLHESFGRIKNSVGGHASILLGTTSGMGIVCAGDPPPGVLRTIKTFSANEKAIPVLKEEINKLKHPRLKKYRNSVQKRIRFIRELFGKLNHA